VLLDLSPVSRLMLYRVAIRYIYYPFRSGQQGTRSKSYRFARSRLAGADRIVGQGLQLDFSVRVFLFCITHVRVVIDID
jgi:hypothetical protein